MSNLNGRRTADDPDYSVDSSNLVIDRAPDSSDSTTVPSIADRSAPMSVGGGMVSGLRPTRTEPRWRHVSLALAIGLLAVAYVLFRGTRVSTVSDFDQLWVGARALMRGVDPYQVVGPKREFVWDYLYYPLPAMLIVAPFALLPLLAARAAFAFVSASALAGGLLRENRVRLLMFLSAPTLIAVGRGQWSPLIVAATFFPWLSWIGAAKPNIALGVLPIFTRPRQALVIGVVGGGLLVLLSFVVFPGWFESWREALSHKGDNAPIVLRLGGAGILLSLVRWRRRETWLLLALGCVPQTPSFYDVVPLFLIARRFRETATLVIGGNLALLLLAGGIGLPAHEIYARFNERVLLWNVLFFYLPCTWFIVRRANVAADVPAPAQTHSGGAIDMLLTALILFSSFFAIWATLAKFV